MTDLDFSSFDENLLSTCSADETVSSLYLPLSFSPIKYPTEVLLPSNEPVQFCLTFETPFSQHSVQSCRCLSCRESDESLNAAHISALSSLVYLSTQTLLAYCFICSQNSSQTPAALSCAEPAGIRCGLADERSQVFLAGCSRQRPLPNPHPTDTSAICVCVFR